MPKSFGIFIKSKAMAGRYLCCLFIRLLIKKSESILDFFSIFLYRYILKQVLFTRQSYYLTKEIGKTNAGLSGAVVWRSEDFLNSSKAEGLRRLSLAVLNLTVSDQIHAGVYRCFAIPSLVFLRLGSFCLWQTSERKVVEENKKAFALRKAGIGLLRV